MEESLTPKNEKENDPMKLTVLKNVAKPSVFCLVTIACFSVWFYQTASAQSSAGETYYGWNGPASGPVTGETFEATVYGDAIEVMARGDTCSRPFYLQGVMSIQPNLNTGTIGGTMTRCTNPDLFDCDHLINYEIGFQGTVRRDPTHRRLYLELTYVMEIWNKDTCKKEKEERRTETLQLMYLPPTPPAKTVKDDFRTIYDGVSQILWDSFWTMGGVSPR